jgi:hypothetical protein
MVHHSLSTEIVMATSRFMVERSFLVLSLLLACGAGVGPSNAQTEEIVRFAVVGDYGDGGTDAGSVATLIQNQNPVFVITVGDNNYNNNPSTATWDLVVGNSFHTYIKYPSGSTSSFTPGPPENAFFPALGNHDWDAGGQTAYFALPGNERYYTFVKGPVQFFCIDSDIREPDGNSSSSTQALWLQAQLAASTAPWKIVYMHEPPFSSCTTHGSTVQMQWPYEQWGADVVFAGHDHVYERIVKDANSDGDSILYVTTGTGGHALYNFGTPIQGSRVRYNANYGSVIAEATGTSLTVRFYSTTGGGTLIDEYTLHNTLTLAPGDVIIAGFQATNTVGSQNPAEFVTLFNTTDSVISLENMNLIARVDPDGAGGSGVGIRWQLSAEPVSLAGKSIAPHSFFLIAESGVASPGGVKDVPTNMDLPTGEGGSTERAIGLELVIGSQHMDYVLYGRNTGSDGGYPDGDLPFDGTTYPRAEIIRNTLGSAGFDEGLVSRDSAGALYAGYAVNGAYADDAPPGVWTSPHSTSFSSYQARNSLSPAVLPPGAQYTLTVNVAGIGTVTKNPDKATYLLNEVVQLTATPPAGWTFTGWSGNLTGSTNPAFITMDGDKIVTATFTVVPLTGFLEPFEDTAFVIGTLVGAHPAWYDAGTGPTITAGVGVAGSKGLSDAAGIFTWEAHPFTWSDTALQKAVVQMDFQTDGSGNFDDDRIGWMTTKANVTSSNFFGVQLDPGGSGYNIEAYWQNGANADVRTSLVNLTGMVANTWYRFRFEATQLGPTDARLDMSLIRLDAGGNPTGTAVTAAVPSTAALGTDAPNSRYFTSPILWPAFKNFTTAAAPADNAYFEAVGSAPYRYTLTINTVGNGSVAKSPDKVGYDPNEIVQLTAIPTSGWRFTGWSGALTGSANPASITMDTSKTVTATFVEYPTSPWIAYNDCAIATGQSPNAPNATTFSIGTGYSGPTSGLLKDITTGNTVGVTITFAQTGGTAYGTTGEPNPASGTDAYATFNGIVDMNGVQSYGSAGWHVDITFAGLDPARKYRFATSAVRGVVSYTDRKTLYTLTGADALTNASSAGVTVVAPNQVYFVTGDNTTLGYVARWIDIDPGTDGSFSVRAEAATAYGGVNQAYAFDVFSLEGQAIVQKTLTVSVAGSGTVTRNPDKVTYNLNEIVQLTAVPTSGHHFVGWSGDLTGSQNPDSVAMSADRNITATFAINQYTITASAGANGSISPGGAVVVNHGASQAFTITPGVGYHVDSVFVDGGYAGALTSYTFTNVTAPHTINAKFAINQYTITASAGPNGAISPSGAVVVNHGANRAFTITPGGGYHVDSVFVDGGYVGAVTNYTFTNVTAPHTISAKFVINQYTITASSGANGSISPSGAVVVTHGASQAFTIVPGAGYHVDSVFVDGGYAGTVTNYTFTNVTAPHTISVKFAINQYIITATAGANGSISPSGAVVVNSGASQAFTITPGTGYHVDSVFVDGGYVGALTNYTFSNVTAPHTINAKFAVNQYTINASAGAQGTISPSGAVIVAHGTSPVFTITPAAGYHVDSVLVDGVYAGTVTSYTFVNVAASHTINAKFAINQYAITVTSGPHGLVSPRSLLVDYGADQTFTMTPADGYHIDSVIVDGAMVGTPVSFTFNNVQANHTMHVAFALNVYTIAASAGSNGSITPSGAVPVAHGTNQPFTITPAVGYSISDVVVDGSSIGPVTTHTFVNVTSNHTIVASFTINGYTITAAAGPNGAISPSGPVSVNWGENRSFTITPGTGYHVDSVIVDNVSVGAVTNYTFTNVTANHTILAKFAINQYTITATAGPNGSINPSGAVTANYGSSPVFTFTSNTGYHVDSVFVDGGYVGAATSYTISNVTANHTILVKFVINRYTITATAGPHGSITPSGAVSVVHGSALAFAIVADPGYHVDSVFVDGGYVGAVTSYPFTNVTANHAINAVFAINRYVISATAGAHGSMNPSGLVIVQQGGSQSFSIIPDAGYHIDSVIVDGVYAGVVSSYTFVNVTSTHTITASFALNAYAITSSAGAHGVITPLGVIGVNHGGSQMFTMTPDPGYHIDSVLVDGAYVGVPGTYTFTNVQEAHTIRVAFVINQYVITATAGPHGTINPGGAVPVNHGATQVFNIVPGTGYHVDSLVVDGVNVTPVTAYTFTNVTSPHAIRAAFALNQYVITASSGPHGSITPSGSVTVGYGAGVVFVMAAEPGFEMRNLIVDGVPVAVTPTYEFVNVTDNHSIAVTFRIPPITVNLGVDMGWNLISVPVEVQDFRKVTLFPTASTAAYGFAAGRYAAQDTLENGQGYWLKFTEEQIVPVFGAPLLYHLVDVQAGWNLIGSVSEGVSAAGVHALGTTILTPFYGYGPSGYGAATLISPGHGYWVKVGADGGLLLATGGTVPPAKASSGEPSANTFIPLRFADAGGRVLTLYAGTRPDGFTPDRYELPPPPPEGAPDIRFNDNASVAVQSATLRESVEYPIRMQGMIYPVSVGADVPGDGTVEYFLRYTIQGKSREVKLAGGDHAVTLPREAEGTLTLRVSPVILPTEYALAQNFPNPFNPNTTIHFSLPSDTRVELRVYDILGQEVRTLLDQEMSAGERAVTFDASGLASGVYFYRLQAGQFSATRKMLMIR